MSSRHASDCTGLPFCENRQRLVKVALDADISSVVLSSSNLSLNGTTIRLVVIVSPAALKTGLRLFHAAPSQYFMTSGGLLLVTNKKLASEVIPRQVAPQKNWLLLPVHTAVPSRLQPLL